MTSSSASQTQQRADATVGAVVRPAAHMRSLGWVMKRALLGMVLIALFSAGAALLTNAGIDPSLEQASE